MEIIRCYSCWSLLQIISPPPTIWFYNEYFSPWPDFVIVLGLKKVWKIPSYLLQSLIYYTNDTLAECLNLFAIKIKIWRKVTKRFVWTCTLLYKTNIQKNYYGVSPIRLWFSEKIQGGAVIVVQSGRGWSYVTK